MSDSLLVAGFALLGTVYGFGADLVAHGWPEHEAGHERRRVDWRSVVVMITGGLVFGALASRWAADPAAMAVYGLTFAALLLLLATDLDQKILPDVITLPLIAFSAVVLLMGWSPALAGKEFGFASGIAAGIGAPLLLLISDRLIGGDLGLGDVKLSVSLGLLFGASLLFVGVLVASVGFAVVLIALIVLRRIGLKTAVPFGPVLIYGAFVAALLG